MPLTSFQKWVARILATQRTPESHVGGGTAINRADSSPRYSGDLDIFHDAAESVASYAELDAKVLEGAGCSVNWILRQLGLYRAEVRRGEDGLRLDWTADSAFRFFPIQPDEEFGYCLHPADLATNKVLALAGRSEIRDLLDLLYLDQTFLSLGALVWAACGKDAGFTPSLLLDQMNRHARYQECDLKAEHLARPVDLKELKQEWLATQARAACSIARLPEPDLGCLYLDAGGNPVPPDPDQPDFANLRRHWGCVHGAWPKITPSSDS